MADAATDRPDTNDMMAVHRVFRESLAAAPGLVDSVSDDERRALIANYLANVMSFLDVHHDGEEQIVFPVLIERSPKSKAVVEQMVAEHEQVVRLLKGVNESVARWEHGDDPDGAAVKASLQALNEGLESHLNEEEADLLPIAGEFLTVEEWGSLPGHGFANFQGDKVWLILGLIREQMNDEQRAAMLQNMPPPARQMWDTMGESAFNELIAEVRQAS